MAQIATMTTTKVAILRTEPGGYSLIVVGLWVSISDLPRALSDDHRHVRKYDTYSTYSTVTGRIEGGTLYLYPCKLRISFETSYWGRAQCAGGSAERSSQQSRVSAPRSAVLCARKALAAAKLRDSPGHVDQQVNIIFTLQISCFTTTFTMSTARRYSSLT